MFSHVVERLQTKAREPQNKHVEGYESSISTICGCLLSGVGDGGLEGEGDVVSCLIKVGV